MLIGEKKNVDGCTCPPHHPAILITAAEIKRGRGGRLAGGMDLFRRRGDAGVWVSRAAPGERAGGQALALRSGNVSLPLVFSAA